MSYIDTVFWLRLEILDISNSSANQILIINFSNSCKLLTSQTLFKILFT